MNKTDNEFKRLEGHPEPKELPMHEVEAAAPEAATPVTEQPVEPVATADIDEVRGGGFGWAALGGLAAAVIVGAVALLAGVWRSPSHQAASPDVLAMYDVGVTEVVGDYDPLPATQAMDKATDVTAPAVTDTAIGSGVGSTMVAVTDTPDAVYLFELDGAQIAENQALNKVAQAAKESDADVTINAYTDESGRTEYNVKLSERRAKAVGDYLVAHGVSPSHIKTHGYGPTHAYPDAAQDRRAEVYIN